MNKTLILIVLGILLAAGGLYYYTSARGNTENSSLTIEENGNGSDETTSLRNLLGLGQNLECSFSSEGTSGKVYIAGERVRGDFTVSDESSGSTTMSMIQDGEWMYYWGSAMPQGMKMMLTIDEVAEDYSAGDIPSLSQSLDAEAQMDYNCDSWRVDSGMFEVPSDIEFIDLSQQFTY